ncbi:MAG TPA: glycosyltransferase [Phycicoccus sp.]|nr:glycosyltransferase [Phycicoccus sp.]
MRIASVPTDHVYVRHLSDPDGRGATVRLPDPRPDRVVTGAPWWPPRVLDPAWVTAHADEFDLVHVHFGYDAESPADLAAWTETLRRLGKPLVVTVHDLRNPHHEDPALHDAQLGVLLAAADAVITLTPGAAREVLRRHGRTARVLPHPHVADLERVARPRRPHEGFVVGVHCKSLRAGMDPLPVVEALARVVPGLPGGRLRVDAHTDVMTPGSPRHDAALAGRLRALAAEGRLDLEVHDYFTHDELLDYLEGLDVSVLPYRFGTHSGWLEACHDLGTTVLAPDCGHYAEQRPVLSYRTGDAASLAGAVELAAHDRPTWRATVDERRAERAGLARAHEEIYRSVLAREVAACTS